LKDLTISYNQKIDLIPAFLYLGKMEGLSLESFEAFAVSTANGGQDGW